MWNLKNKINNKIEADSQTQRPDGWLSEDRGFEGLSDRGEGIKKDKLVATE